MLPQQWNPAFQWISQNVSCHKETWLFLKHSPSFKGLTITKNKELLLHMPAFSLLRYLWNNFQIWSISKLQNIHDEDICCFSLPTFFSDLKHFLHLEKCPSLPPIWFWEVAQNSNTHPLVTEVGIWVRPGQSVSYSPTDWLRDGPEPYLNHGHSVIFIYGSGRERWDVFNILLR